MQSFRVYLVLASVATTGCATVSDAQEFAADATAPAEADARVVLITDAAVPPVIEADGSLPPDAHVSCASQHRDDDNTMEQHTSTDYSDDHLEKTIVLPNPALANAAQARLWMFVIPYNCPSVTNCGGQFQDEPSHTIQINGNPAQTLTLNPKQSPLSKLDPAQTFSDLTDPSLYGWIYLYVPLAWLVAGDNYIYVTEASTASGWNYNNLAFGVDTSSDADRSWWFGNYPPTPQACSQSPAGCTGELMIYIELEPASCP